MIIQETEAILDGTTHTLRYKTVDELCNVIKENNYFILVENAQAFLGQEGSDWVLTVETIGIKRMQTLDILPSEHKYLHLTLDDGLRYHLLYTLEIFKPLEIINVKK